jgi:hypothetical protein
VFNFRASVRTAGVVAGITVLALGVFAGSAFAWSKCKNNGGNEETHTSPGHSNGPPDHSEKGDNEEENGYHPPTGGDTSNEESPAAAPVVDSTPAPAAPVATELLPASPQPAAAAAPATTPAPTTPGAETSPPVVKGEIGTAWSGSGGGGQAPTVLAAAGDVGQSAGEGGGLAQTGFGLLPVAILGGFALGGSAFFFRRFQGC